MTDKSQDIKIADLNPNTKKGLTLTFEVAQIISRSNNEEEVFCRIVDETGIVTAFFNQYGKFVKEGNVYQLIGWKCRVHQHHLRLEMSKKSILTKKPLKIGFRDMENDLSTKFYAVNKNNSESEAKHIQKKQKVQQPQKIEKVKNMNQNNPKQQKKEERPKQKTEKDKTEKSQNYKSQKETKKKYVQKGKEVDNEYHRVPKIKDHEQQREQKTKNQTQKQTKYIQRIKLKDFPNYQQQYVSLCVKVYLKKSVSFEKYILCKVADSTGSAFIEFNSSIHLNDETWYNLINFKIFADKKYGFIAAQQTNSSLSTIENNEEAVDLRPIIFKN